MNEILKEEKKSIIENTKIIRILFEKIIEKVPKKVNDIVHIYFGFIIFYKNYSKYKEKQPNIKEYLKSLLDVITNFNILKIKEKNKFKFYKFGLLPKYIYEGLNINILKEPGKKATLINYRLL